ncbi:uncharacterized protein [Anabrus simplex]
MMYRVKVHGTTTLPDCEPESWTRSIICKCLPQNTAKRQAFKSDALFKNEIAVYTQALPALLAFQASRGVKAPFRAIPRCLFARKDMLILEDLKPLGFEMVDRKTGLDASHCLAVLRSLAQLHALSLAMKIHEKERFQLVVASSVQEALFVDENEAWYRNYYRTATRNAIAMVQSALAPDQKRDSYLQKMQEFVGDNSFFSRMISLVAPHEPLAVLCHGDCWTNNVLFRYSETGDILEVCLIDFQLARYGSPALDLANLLYICTTGELRSSYMQKFLESYRSTLVETLSELGCFDPDLVKSTPFASPNILGEMLHAEMRRCGPFALGLALDMIPICTCDSEQAPDMYDKEDTQSPEGNNTPVWSWNWNDACAKKMTELVMELVDHGGL